MILPILLVAAMNVQYWFVVEYEPADHDFVAAAYQVSDPKEKDFIGTEAYTKPKIKPVNLASL